MKTKVGIIGATGYAGAELIRILYSHPMVELHKIASVSFTGQKISDIYPALSGYFEDVLCPVDEVIAGCDVIFAAVPHGVSQPLAENCDKAGKYFIDLGADFRIKSEETYEKWYGVKFTDKELHERAVYGLCEVYRDDIKGKKIVANPGCYPTATALGLYPSLKNNLCDTSMIIVDAKSGATGAGRGLSQDTHFCDLNEAFHPYKAGAHRHTPEIEQTLSNMAEKDVKITFVPHLLPINRGIISTIYAKKNDYSLTEIHDIYTKCYQNDKFVTVLPLGKNADLKNVAYSNNCHISLHEDEHTGMLVIASAIDNIVKGASGQAVQNMNLMLGFEEDMGLMFPSPCI